MQFALRWLVPWFLLTLIAAGADEVVDELGFSRAPYVQMATPTSMHVVWRTVDSIDPEVRFGIDSKLLDRRVGKDEITVRKRADSEEELKEKPLRLHSGPKGTRQYEASLTELQPDTRYFYAIYDKEERLTPDDESYHFRTSPEAGQAKEALFWVVGDSGTGEKEQSQVHEAMLDYTKSIERPIDFYLHVGDMAYSKGTDDQFQRKFFKMYEKTLRHAVVWPAMGNHEGASADGAKGIGPYYDAYICPTRGEAGGVASGYEGYYSFDHGNIHFVVLNSFDVDRTRNGAMAAWLQEDLSRVKADWLIAYWHHPPYSKGTHDSDIEDDSTEMREHILPILESHGVDLVITGHSHIYERSMLMDGAYQTPTTVEGVILDDGDGDPTGDGPYRKVPGLTPNQGTIQVVAGHGGTGVGRMGTMPVMKRIMVENGSVLISVNGSVLDGVMINLDGVKRDRFQLRKEPGVVAQRVADPVILPPFAPPGEEMPRDFIELIPEGAAWAYHLGKEAPAEDWNTVGFDDKPWAQGEAGFGYGDDDDKTVLEDLAEADDRLYVRRTFTVSAHTERSQLGIAIRYDDAFIAYVNGKEVLRQGIGHGSGPEAEEIADHEADDEKFEFFPIKDAEAVLRDGVNLLAIEAHSIDSDEGDFTLDPWLVEELDSSAVGGGPLPLLATNFLPATALWRYNLDQDYEDENWEKPEYSHDAWPRERMPMGYGRRLQYNHSLREMEGEKSRARFRREFVITDESDFERLGLRMYWDDGFIAYLNGHELGRAGVARGSGAQARGFGHTRNPVGRYFPFSRLKEHLRLGRNLLAIEGHNERKDSSDFFMAPSIDLAWTEIGERVPRELEEVIPRKKKWEILEDAEPDAGWTTVMGQDWEDERMPIGYGYQGLGTTLDKMKDRYARLYVRKDFELATEDEAKGLGLIVGWDDAFIAYLNGKEVARVGVTSGRGAKAQGIYKLSQGIFRYFPLDAFPEAIQLGKNVLALEVHNQKRSSSDFIIDASLVRVKPSTKPWPMPKTFMEIIPKQAKWRYLAGEHPEEAWAQRGYDDKRWPQGNAGFGYGDDDDETSLEMEDQYTAVYIRRAFELGDPASFAQLGLGIRWDDGFIAYLNGEEILRVNVKEGRGMRADKIRSVNAEDDFVAFRLQPFASLLREGTNVIAIEGHNVRKDSSDFTLDPFVFSADWKTE